MRRSLIIRGKRYSERLALYGPSAVPEFLLLMKRLLIAQSSKGTFGCKLESAALAFLPRQRAMIRGISKKARRGGPYSCTAGKMPQGFAFRRGTWRSLLGASPAVCQTLTACPSTRNLTAEYGMRLFNCRPRHMSTPGFYATNPRALRLGEIARMTKPWRLPIAYLITRFKKPAPAGWMPRTWKDLECGEAELSARFWEATADQRQKFASLGFTIVGFKKVRNFLNPIGRDNGGINYLDASRSCYAQLLYHRVFAPAPINAERESLSIAFTAEINDRIFSCTNVGPTFDSLPSSQVIRMRSNNPREIYSVFSKNLSIFTNTARRFADDASLQSWFDSNQVKVFEHNVQRELYIKMSEAEVEAARRRLQPPVLNR